jgi:hypothetical protein
MPQYVAGLRFEYHVFFLFFDESPSSFKDFLRQDSILCDYQQFSETGLHSFRHYKLVEACSFCGALLDPTLIRVVVIGELVSGEHVHTVHSPFLYIIFY